MYISNIVIRSIMDELQHAKKFYKHMYFMSKCAKQYFSIIIFTSFLVQYHKMLLENKVAECHELVYYFVILNSKTCNKGLVFINFIITGSLCRVLIITRDVVRINQSKWLERKELRQCQFKHPMMIYLT